LDTSLWFAPVNKESHLDIEWYQLYFSSIKAIYRMKCLVVDDEQLARKLVISYIDKHPDLELSGECKSAVDAIKFIQDNEVDIIFLDIQMPGLTGLDFAKTIKLNHSIIFTTAYTEYAVEGFALDAVDYLLKPFKYERFAEAVEKAKRRSKNEAAPESEKDIEYIKVKADHRIYKINIEELNYIEGLKEYVSFYTSSEKIIVLDSLKRLENSLPSNFVRVHKSYIINISKVQSVYGNLAEIGKKQIPIGKSYKDAAMKKIFN